MKLAFLLLLTTVTTAAQESKEPTRTWGGERPSHSSPRVIKKVEPEYTRKALAAKVEGSVILSLTVTTDGTPSEIKVVQGLGNGLDKKAVECLGMWRFRPALRFGVPIPAKATIEIIFRAPQSPIELAGSLITY